MSVAAAVIALGLLTAAAASAATLPVTVQFQAFAPFALDALPGDTVVWTNTGGRLHTVTADDGQFDSGDLPDGRQFKLTLTATGTYDYHCNYHRGMTGEIDVRRVTLDPLPAGPLLPGSSLTATGRTADPAVPVRVELEAGAGFETVATALPGADGRWMARVKATRGGRVRAGAGPDVSRTRHLLVVKRTVRVRPTGRGISVTVVPSLPHGRVSLQLFLRERFGWWTVAHKRLDYLSRASFRVTRSARARVVLLGRDAWTPLAVSQVVRIRGK
ncbi:MAG TPA: cupredoxin domain-containing protein [Solirubrobacteraceae bacterium]|nr:cupredoxin domain-containing protein [Solirubrobacteraceae bacterium]